MSKVQTSLHIDEQYLIEAKETLKSLGMNFTEAGNVFTSMVIQTKGLPFDVKIPNKKTIKVIKEARQGKNIDEIK